jgi:hypothetical protein
MTRPLYLYHGTSLDRVRPILREGLRPRRGKGQWSNAPSRAGHVYLTNAYAVHFAKVAAGNAGSRANGAVLRIKVDDEIAANFYADEDALEQYNRDIDKARMPTMEERTAWYRNTWQFIDAAKKWESSIGFMGTCSHHGVISPGKIDAVAIIRPGTPIWFWSDPQITATNYVMLGAFYRALTALPFDEGMAVEREWGNSSELERIVGKTMMDRLREPVALEGVTTTFRNGEEWRPADIWVASKAA